MKRGWVLVFVVFGLNWQVCAYQSCPDGSATPNFNQRNHRISDTRGRGDLGPPPPEKPTRCSTFCNHGYANTISCYSGDTNQPFQDGSREALPQDCGSSTFVRGVFDSVCGITQGMLDNGCISEAELAAIQSSQDYLTGVILQLDGTGAQNPWNQDSFDQNGDLILSNEDSWTNVVEGYINPDLTLLGTFTQTRKQLWDNSLSQSFTFTLQSCWDGVLKRISSNTGQDTFNDAFCNPVLTLCRNSSTLPPSVPTPRPSLNVQPTAPTFTPTRVPTFNPTDTPTRNPTTNPTKTPTQNPSSKPTNNPTFNPTTKSPTFNPTSQPTPAPSDSPTSNPTFNPTTSPTQVPSNNPTRNPTSNPTTQNPTYNPTTPKPTDSPTNTPTQNPSSKPTNNPTFNPTDSPTQIPSSNPTRNPTSKPTTQSPTINPSTSPTPSPSSNPTTSNPTSIPTLRPTTQPIENPTGSPSVLGSTASPTLPPSQSPSDSPSASPSTLPTASPTVLPSSQPSQPPSSPKQSAQPSSNPTSSPSAVPTTFTSSNELATNSQANNSGGGGSMGALVGVLFLLLAMAAVAVLCMYKWKKPLLDKLCPCCVANRNKKTISRLEEESGDEADEADQAGDEDDGTGAEALVEMAPVEKPNLEVSQRSYTGGEIGKPEKREDGDEEEEGEGEESTEKEAKDPDAAAPRQTASTVPPATPPFVRKSSKHTKKLAKSNLDALKSL